MKATGLTLYEGPSVLDGEPIVVIATLHSSNRKTGDMVQTWILRQDMRPMEAVRSGADSSVCGNCLHRHHTKGACYVLPHQAPTAVWRGYQAGRYPMIDGKMRRRLRGRAIRLGAYGDPAAAPFEVWEKLAGVANMVTGYTHQVAHPNFDRRLLDLCMVSVDSEASSAAHQMRGRRTFRVKQEGEPLMQGEVVCPASYKADTQCIDCGLCNGAAGNGPSVVIDAHGQRAKRFDVIAKAS